MTGGFYINAYRAIALKGKSGRGLFTKVSIGDYHRVISRGWHGHIKACRKNVYAVSAAKVYLHRLIVNAIPGVFVDHINRDTLDNRRCNLRTCTPQESSRNRTASGSGYKGVSKKDRHWVARIEVGNTTTLLGKFPSPEAAAAVYNRAALSMFGDFAFLNRDESGAAL